MIDRRALVVGHGSIGARHARLLAELGTDVAVVSARDVDAPKRYTTLEQACDAHRPSYVVIADATSRHHETLAALAALGYTGTVLVEKPVFHRLLAVPLHRFSDVRVAYNLRFHPVVSRLRQELTGQRILSVQAYVGQYLPHWRPGTDYRLCYSADAERGGGVLLDLSHDLDLVTWTTGEWQRVAALGGRFGRLEINSDDVFALLIETERCPAVTVQLNYLDRRGRREYIVNTDEHTYQADLVQQALFIDHEKVCVPVDQDASYRAMHVAMLSSEPHNACSLHEGLATVALVDAARRAATNRDWVGK